MNLQLLIKQYFDYRTSLGWRACSESGYLGGFGRFMGADADVAAVRVEHIQAFLAGAGPLTSTWHTKYTILRSFYRYAVSRGYVKARPSRPRYRGGRRGLSPTSTHARNCAACFGLLTPFAVGVIASWRGSRCAPSCFCSTVPGCGFKKLST